MQNKFLSKTHKTLKAAVIGNPISHSLSPKMHNFWLQKYKINGTYEAIKVEEQNLEQAIKSMVDEGYVGFNVTIPHKEKVFELLQKMVQQQKGEISNSASILRAVNTVTINNNQLQGYNSDDFGFAQNLKNTIPNIIFDENKNAFLIGAGGAARAIIYSLIIDFKIKNIFITNRTKEKVDQIIQDFSRTPLLTHLSKLHFLEKSQFEKNLANCDLLINSSSLGMLNQVELEINLQNLQKSAIVYDIVYKPLMTNLLKNATTNGNKIVTGIGMLAFQAALGFEKWFDKKPEVSQDLLDYLIT